MGLPKGLKKILVSGEPEPIHNKLNLWGNNKCSDKNKLKNVIVRHTALYFIIDKIKNRLPKGYDEKLELS